MDIIRGDYCNQRLMNEIVAMKDGLKKRHHKLGPSMWILSIWSGLGVKPNCISADNMQEKD